MTTYRGNCHCGDFVFEVTMPKPFSVGYTCNCSICYKKGYVYYLMDGKDGAKFSVVKGSLDKLTSYVFGKKFDHKFCGNCGSGVVVAHLNGDPNAMGINARCFQGPIDLWSLEKIQFDGKSIPPAYVEPDYSGPEPTGGPVGDEPSKIYHGSCHCGAVRISLRSKPLDTLDPAVDADRVIDCSCSVCIRGGYVWIYPAKDQSAIQGEENLTYYSFPLYTNRKAFCRICGVHIFNGGVSYTPEELAKLPPSARSEEACKRRERKRDTRNINTRVLHGVDVENFTARQSDAYHGYPPEYVNP